MIIYLSKIDYTLSLLISVSIIISVIIFNKNNIEFVKNKYKLFNTPEIKEEVEKIVEENVEKEEDDENKQINGASITLENNIDSFTNNEIDSIQNNIFELKNNKIYMSANYNSPIITTQGDFN